MWGGVTAESRLSAATTERRTKREDDRKRRVDGGVALRYALQCLFV